MHVSCIYIYTHTHTLTHIRTDELHPQANPPQPYHLHTFHSLNLRGDIPCEPKAGIIMDMMIPNRVNHTNRI